MPFVFLSRIVSFPCLYFGSPMLIIRAPTRTALPAAVVRGERSGRKLRECGDLRPIPVRWPGARVTRVGGKVSLRVTDRRVPS